MTVHPSPQWPIANCFLASYYRLSAVRRSLFWGRVVRCRGAEYVREFSVRLRLEGRSTPFGITARRRLGRRATISRASSCDVQCNVKRERFARLYQRKSQIAFRVRRDEPSQRRNPPRGDQTTCFLSTRQWNSVGNVGKLYTPVRCTMSAQRILLDIEDGVQPARVGSQYPDVAAEKCQIPAEFVAGTDGPAVKVAG